MASFISGPGWTALPRGLTSFELAKRPVSRPTGARHPLSMMRIGARIGLCWATREGPFLWPGLSPVWSRLVWFGLVLVLEKAPLSSSVYTVLDPVYQSRWRIDLFITVPPILPSCLCVCESVWKGLQIRIMYPHLERRIWVSCGVSRPRLLAFLAWNQMLAPCPRPSWGDPCRTRWGMGKNKEKKGATGGEPCLLSTPVPTRRRRRQRATAWIGIALLRRSLLFLMLSVLVN